TATSVWLVCRLVAVTVAPGITPPCSSVTVPEIEARSNCAHAGVPTHNAAAISSRQCTLLPTKPLLISAFFPPPGPCPGQSKYRRPAGSSAPHDGPWPVARWLHQYVPPGQVSRSRCGQKCGDSSHRPAEWSRPMTQGTGVDGQQRAVGNPGG